MVRPLRASGGKTALSAAARVARAFPLFFI